MTTLADMQRAALAEDLSLLQALHATISDALTPLQILQREGHACTIDDEIAAKLVVAQAQVRILVGRMEGRKAALEESRP